jgi:hypothetical protein
MAIPESPISPINLTRIETALKTNACATLAAAVIGKMNRHVSIKEAIEIQQDIYFANYGGEFAGHGRYEEWKKTSEDRLSKVRA